MLDNLFYLGSDDGIEILLCILHEINRTKHIVAVATDEIDP